MVQLVCGSPVKQGLKAINPYRSFLDVFQKLEWSKGYSLVGVELCKSLTESVQHPEIRITKLVQQTENDILVYTAA